MDLSKKVKTPSFFTSSMSMNSLSNFSGKRFFQNKGYEGYQQHHQQHFGFLLANQVAYQVANQVANKVANYSKKMETRTKTQNECDELPLKKMKLELAKENLELKNRMIEDMKSHREEIQMMLVDLQGKKAGIKNEITIFKNELFKLNEEIDYHNYKYTNDLEEMNFLSREVKVIFIYK